MTRSMEAAVTTAVQQDNVRAEILARFEFDSGTLNFWTGIGDLVLSNGHASDGTFTGTGHLGTIGSVGEASDLSVFGLTFTLTGLDAALISIILSEKKQGRKATVWLVFFDSDWAVIQDPLQIFGGRINTSAITDAGKTATVAVSAESRLIDLARPNHARFYSDQDQQWEYAGDLFFEFNEATQEAVIYWGKTKLEPATPGDSGGQAPSSPSPAAASAPAESFDNGGGYQDNDTGGNDPGPAAPGDWGGWGDNS